MTSNAQMYVHTEVIGGQAKPMLSEFASQISFSWISVCLWLLQCHQTQRTGDGEEVGVERDNSVNWLQLKLFCNISNTVLTKTSQVTIVPTKMKGSEDVSFVSFTKSSYLFPLRDNLDCWRDPCLQFVSEHPSSFSGHEKYEQLELNKSFHNCSELKWVKWVHQSSMPDTAQISSVGYWEAYYFIKRMVGEDFGEFLHNL